jgi:hypothetical protein
MYQELAMKKRGSRFWVKKVLAVVFLLTMTGMAGLYAIDIVLHAPQLDTSNPLAAEIQDLIDDAFEVFRDALQSEVGDIDPKPQKLIGAFADSSVFASTGASLRSYQGYNTFALTVGAVGGFQLPRNVFYLIGNIANIEGEIEELLADIERDLDVQLGINPQILNAQLGINSRFLLKGLYLGLKGGYMNLPSSFFENYIDGFPLSFQTWSAGALLNYQLIPQSRLFGGMIVWRGLNVGAGFIYQSTSLKLDVSLLALAGNDELRFDIWEDPLGIGKITAEISDPKLHFGFTVNTYTVPLEAVTSIRLLGFLNASLGVGADLGFGSARLGGGINGDINIYGLENYGLSVERQGGFSVTMGGDNSPTLFNPKVMGSLGISVGPAIILDIPITYYFQNNGFNFGVTLGIAL